MNGNIHRRNKMSKSVAQKMLDQMWEKYEKYGEKINITRWMLLSQYARRVDSN